METQFKYLQELADQYRKYYQQPEELFLAINELPAEEIEEIYRDYRDSTTHFYPVNLLRCESARLIREGKSIGETEVEEIKQKIREKDLDYFQEYGPIILKGLKEYAAGKRDMFANWQRPFSVFHTFLFRGKTRETTNQYLDQLSKQLKQDLGLQEYAIHYVDFFGPTNFGADLAWIALYPAVKESHKEAYQFFLGLRPNPEAGRVAGHGLHHPEPNRLVRVGSYEEAVKVLATQRDDILSLNRQIRNYFKFAPGANASEWERFREEKIIAVGYSELGVGDISALNSREELNIKVGLEPDNQSNRTWNLWLFRTANVNDVVFATKGVNTCLGIGLIEGDYQYQETENIFPHRRRVNWITDKVYNYKSSTLKGYKTLFRPDTFSPTKVWQFLFNEYVRLYPELADVFDRYDLKYNVEPPTPAAITDEAEEEMVEETDRPLNFWWLNANPLIWSISKQVAGERQTYTARNEKGNKRRIYKYFETVQPGDLMIGYESSPVKQVVGMLEVTKALHHEEEEGEVIEFELVEKFDVPVHWNEMSNHPGLQTCEVFINNQGSLFRLTEEEFDIIRDLVDTKNIVYEQKLQRDDRLPYRYRDDPDKPFIPADEFSRIVALLERKKNIILQGPPGVGKTFIARKIAYELMGHVNDAQIQLVQFHQSYSYEDFVQGLRPSRSGGFELKNGIFYAFCKQAHAHPERPYFLIIDEINRGNLSKVFGELMMLIEADKRSEKFAVKLAYAEEDDAEFFVPHNLHLIGTMNTADRSLALVDYALRRRFAFVDIYPHFGETFRSFLSQRGMSAKLIDHICVSIAKVNQEISTDHNLGQGFQIGYSYFCGFGGKEEAAWLEDVVRFEIKPLLEEIWFDDPDKVKQMLSHLSQ